MDKYEIIGLIGTGSFSHVNKAIKKDTKSVVALKCIDKVSTGRPRADNRHILIALRRRRFAFQIKYEPKELKNFRTECKIHEGLRHPNIIRMVECFETPENIFFVTDIAAIDLHKFMKSRPGQKLPEDHVRSLTANLVSGLNYLHSERIVHRDLKPQNILLNENGMDAMICDFGLARNMTKDTHLMQSVKGTPLYMAPEVMSNEPYDFLADFWSLGCIIYEMLVGQPLFKAKSMPHLQNLQRQSIKWPSASENCTSFLQGLLKKDGKERFTWPSILQHPFVEGRLIILAKGSDLSLTNDLTASQTYAKEKQRGEIISKKQKKIIAEREKLCKANVGMRHAQAAALLANQHNDAIATDDNTSLSSLDSVHAIVQTDVENIETDAETAPAIRAVPENSNLIIQRFAEPNKPKLKAEPAIDNSNLVVGTMADNLKNDDIDVRMKRLSLAPNETAAPTVYTGRAVSPKHGNNKDLERRKLSQNLDNFSIRQGTGNGLATLADANEETSRSQKEKDKLIPIVETNVSVSDSPIENEEWLAFIRSSMQEVLSGQVDSLKQPTLVSVKSSRNHMNRFNSINSN